MTYPTLAAVFLSIAVVGAVLVPALAPVTRSRQDGRAHTRWRPWPHLGAVLSTVLALVVLTAVFDSLMIAAELFHYDPAALAGPHIGLAPIEDFAYPLATAILLPAVWETLRRRRRRAAATPSAARPEDVRNATEGGPDARQDEA